MSTSDDRLIELFERMSALETRHEELDKKQAGSIKEQHEMNQHLEKFMRKFERYETRWGMLLMMGSAVVAVLAFFKSEILRRIFG